MKIPNDVIIQKDSSDAWILYNVFTHSTLAVEIDTLELLNLINDHISVEDLIQKCNNEYFTVWKIGIFSNTDCLLADPTNRIRGRNSWPEPQHLNIHDLLELLKNSYFLIDNEEAYLNIFQQKKSLLDKKNLGNFHQQLGQHLMLEKRINPETWWVNQKFDLNFQLHDTLYKAIQENFLKKLFPKKFNATHKILDVGCGVGYYSKMMSETGAQVLGIDTNKNFIEIASKNSSSNLSFKTTSIGSANSLDWIESNSFDFVFMSDALLFYFVSPEPKNIPDIKILFNDIQRILKPNGQFLSLEPHGIFFLSPWLGDVSHPFTIITEYRQKLFRITPNIEEILSSFLSSDFILHGFKELYIDESFSSLDKRVMSFSKEFPLWWYFELGKNVSTSGS